MSVCSTRLALVTVLLLLLIIVIVVLSLLLTRQKSRKNSLVWRANTTSLSETTPPIADKLLTSGLSIQNGEDLTPVIPLTWHSPSGTYSIGIYVGNNLVHAAFDTASAHVIVNTEACKSCSGPAYQPSQSQSAYAIVDKRPHAKQGDVCTSSISYVSQSNVLHMISDTIRVPRTIAPDCLGRVVNSADTDMQVAPLLITDFPIGGIVEHTGQSSVNVFGVSGVITTPENVSSGAPAVYVLPTCEHSSQPVYESAFLQSLYMYNKQRDEPMVWSVRFAPRRQDGAVIALRPHKSPCDRPKFYTPAIRSLPDGASELVTTPYRYYLIHVQAASTYHGDKQPLPYFPKYLIVDTATTQFMLPSPTDVDALNRRGLEIRVEGGGVLSWPVTPDDKHSSVPMYTVMPNEVAQEFSVSKNVGILGVMGMRGRYLEFTFAEPRTIGFG